MRHPILLALAVVIAGCANEPPEAEPAMLAPPPGTAAVAPPYQMTAKEMALDCAKLTGFVRMRQMALKDAENRKSPNAAGRAIHEVAATVNGAPRRGIDDSADAAADRAKIAAYKARMAEKKCKPVDDVETAAAPGKAPAAKAK